MGLHTALGLTTTYFPSVFKDRNSGVLLPFSEAEKRMSSSFQLKYSTSLRQAIRLKLKKKKKKRFRETLVSPNCPELNAAPTNRPCCSILHPSAHSSRKQLQDHRLWLPGAGPLRSCSSPRAGTGTLLQLPALGPVVVPWLGRAQAASRQTPSSGSWDPMQQHYGPCPSLASWLSVGSSSS